MGTRKAFTKSERFEIFKRDGFRCVYCGSTPVQSALRVDHVVPVSEGGTNKHSNLVTACFDCNAGKAARLLEDKRLPIGDATAVLDHAEQIKSFLEAQREMEAAQESVTRLVASRWEELLGPISQEMFDRLGKLSREWSIERLSEAMEITSRKLGSLGRYDYPYAVRQQKYFQGILRKWREEAGDEAP